MSDANTGTERPIPWLIAIAALLWLTFNCSRGHEMAPLTKPMPVAPAPQATTAPEPRAVPAMPAAAKIFFAAGKDALPDDADDRMTPVIEYLQANGASKAVISAFHAPTGDKAQNQELAKNRATALRAALKAAGIEDERILMAEPQETAGTDADARRVEVAIQK